MDSDRLGSGVSTELLGRQICSGEGTVQCKVHRCTQGLVHHGTQCFVHRGTQGLVHRDTQGFVHKGTRVCTRGYSVLSCLTQRIGMKTGVLTVTGLALGSAWSWRGGRSVISGSCWC